MAVRAKERIFAAIAVLLGILASLAGLEVVMRFLPVADVNRSVAFYRDVLGFEIKPLEGGIEAVLGPARIRFQEQGRACR